MLRPLNDLVRHHQRLMAPVLPGYGVNVMADLLSITRSPLSRIISWAGQNVRVEIYKLGVDDWTLELAGGISLIWLRSFSTDADAFAEFVDQADSFGFPAQAASAEQQAVRLS